MMQRVIQILIGVIVGAITLVVMPFEAAAQCGGLHTLQVMDLDMTPDPTFQGQPIQQWIVKLRADGNGECATRILVRDRDQVAGQDVAWTLRPGLNEIRVPAHPGYWMQGQDHCFIVVADIQNSQRPIDAARRFCARMLLPSWTLR